MHSGNSDSSQKNKAKQVYACVILWGECGRMTAGQFNKTTKKKQPKRARPKAPLLPPRKPAKPDGPESAVTRVEPGLDRSAGSNAWE